MAINLPLEVVSHVLSFLDGRQRLSAGLVCKLWLQASDTFLEDVRMIIIARPPSQVFRLSRRFSCIEFISTDIDDECVDILNHLGPQLLHLSFYNCRLSSEKKVSNCDRLKSLEANSAGVCLAFSSLPCLEYLNLQFMSDLTDEKLFAIDGIVSSNLKIFSMPICVTYDERAYRRYYPNETTYESYPSNMVLSFTALEHFVNKRAKTLISLQLPENIHSKAALRLSKVDHLALKYVDLNLCQECDHIVVAFCRSQPHLVSIKLSWLVLLMDTDVEEICRLLPELREFAASACPGINKSIITLFRMPDLRSICLSSCFEIEPSTFDRMIPSFAPLNLSRLDLSYTKIRDRHILDLLPHLSRLVNLNLSGSEISDCTLIAISDRLTYLRKLGLGSCAQLSDYGLCNLGNLRRLVMLNLRNCSRITYAGILVAVKFPYLKRLYLPPCQNITSRVLQMVEANNPCLSDIYY